MAARLAWARATVKGPQDAEEVSVMVSGNKLTATRRDGSEVLHVENVTNAIRVDRKTWRIETPEGEYLVTRAGCGCGGRS